MCTCCQVYLPSEAQWYSWPDGKRTEAGNYNIPVTLQTVPVYIRGGEIIARRERTRRSTDAMANDPYTLVVAVAWNDNLAHAHSKYVVLSFELRFAFRLLAGGVGIFLF